MLMTFKELQESIFPTCAQCGRRECEDITTQNSKLLRTILVMSFRLGATLNNRPSKNNWNRKFKNLKLERIYK